MQKSDLLAWLREQIRQWEAFLDEFGRDRLEQPGVNGPRPPALPGPDVVLGWGGLPPVSSQPAPVYAPAPGRGGNARR